MEYGLHALEQMKTRSIRNHMVERTVLEPEFQLPDGRFEDRTCAFRRFDELGGKWLRVVYERHGDSVTVVTAFPDRDAEKLKRKKEARK